MEPGPWGCPRALRRASRAVGRDSSLTSRQVWPAGSGLRPWAASVGVLVVLVWWAAPVGQSLYMVWLELHFIFTYPEKWLECF